jgi:hypothetical protein
MPSGSIWKPCNFPARRLYDTRSPMNRGTPGLRDGLAGSNDEDGPEYE